MNPPDPATLPLRDIHLPEPIGWWPLAPGWWFLAGLLLMLAISAAWFAWQRRRTRTQRAALAELADIEARFTHDADAHACARDLSTLVRRLARACAPDSAALTRDAWLRELRDTGHLELPPDLEPVLLAAAYSPARAAALGDDACVRLIAILRTWIPSTVRWPTAAAAR